MVDKFNENRTPENKVQTLLIPKTSVLAIADEIFKGMQTNKPLIYPTPTTALFDVSHINAIKSL